MADGTICKPGKTHSDNCRLQINISAKDIELLELFKQDIKAFDTEINDEVFIDKLGNVVCNFVIVSIYMAFNDSAFSPKV